MKIERRSVLRAGGAVLLAAAPLSLLLNRRGQTEPAKTPASAGPHALGGIERDPNRLLDLRAGFTYTVVERFGDAMSDGHRVPGLADGMACFPGPDGTLVLMRNHEVERQAAFAAYRGKAPAHAYDPNAYGGVTRVVVDARTGERRSSNLVLAGTLRNCAGGPSPWGWLSCEEHVDPGHGYVFLCRTDATKLAPAERIPAYGRFNHEAVCIDPKTLGAYLTEDRVDGCLYRMVPTDRARPFEGHLEALAVRGSPRLDTGRRLEPGRRYPVEWIRIPDPDPKDDSVRHQALELGAAIVRRGEGIWYHDGSVYIAATIGGPRGTGQILRLHLGDRPELEEYARSEDPAALDYPDNITVAPWGDLYLAEDGAGEQYVRVITTKGKLLDLARNARSSGELAGVCFSPDGTLLFVNLYNEGITVAIRGPFRELAA
ncbi:MAG TPA: alkaline phosphatase PhoX [Polyangiaceae bacterium]|nr:alkaline phosphatase PhoX [Polyangiaceae bacterium]